MVPLFIVPVSPVVVPCFMASWDAPGPTLPWLDAPSFCAKAAGEASAKIQAEAKTELLH